MDEVLAHGPTKGSVVLHGGLQVDLRMVEADSYGALIQYFSGSQQHNIRLRELANRMGLSLNEYGITACGDRARWRSSRSRQTSTHVSASSTFRRSCGKGLWEVEAAARGALPALVELGDVRGDLHCHTTESDGRDTLPAMVDDCTQPRVWSTWPSPTTLWAAASLTASARSGWRGTRPTCAPWTHGSPTFAS